MYIYDHIKLIHNYLYNSISKIEKMFIKINEN